MKVKTSELIGPALDWAVSQCEGVNAETFRLFYHPTEPSDYDVHGYPEFHYSSVWSQGGPIIQREKLEIRCSDYGWQAFCFGFAVSRAHSGPRAWADGPTPLIAAMRCYVATKFGDEAYIPGEVLR